MNDWKGDVLALVAGGILPLAFAPFAWWPLAIVAMLLLLQCLQRVHRRRAAWRGYLFGLGYFGIGVSWVYISVRLFGHATAPLAASITLLFILTLACYTALAAWLSAWLSSWLSLPWAITFAAVWIWVEWLRGWLFGGFGWLQLGYAFIDTPLAGYAPFGGVLGIGYLVLLSIAAALVLLNKRTKIVSKLFAVSGIAVVWLLPLAIALPSGTQTHGKPLQVALLQANIPQQIKWHPDQRLPTLAWYRQMTQAHWNKDVIVWPETAIPAFAEQVADFVTTMHVAAQASATILLAGLPMRDADGAYYNALFALGNRVRDADSHYQKRHLVPFGEYLPFKSLLDPILGYLQIPMSDFSAGKQARPLVKAGKQQAGVFICYEITFGNDVIRALPEAAWLVNISNDAWFGNSLAPYQHLQIARLRALETGRYILRATNTGISAIIQADGTVQNSLAWNRRGAVTGTIKQVKGATPYSIYGDYAVLLVIVLSLAIIWLLRHRFTLQ